MPKMTSDIPDEAKLLNTAQICAMLGISRALFERLIRKPDFPRRVQLSKQTRRWRREEIEAWLTEQTAA